jgi:prophage maintenance system killer protein
MTELQYQARSSKSFFLEKRSPNSVVWSNEAHDVPLCSLTRQLIPALCGYYFLNIIIFAGICYTTCMKLLKRQHEILTALFSAPLGTATLLEKLAAADFILSEDTLQRELKLLASAALVVSEGAGPSRLHGLTTLGRLYSTYTPRDIDAYLRDESRLPSQYLFDMPESMARYLEESSLHSSEQSIIKKYQDFRASVDPSIFARWQQKWLIEFAWKSSSIEGNTYSILETETLLLDKIEATGKSHQEAVMIINHQKAYDFILKNKKMFQTVTVSQILKLHELLVQELDVSFGIRSAAVRISGSKYIPLSHSQQIVENLEKIVVAINSMKEPVDKALASVLLIAYLQPFADGNKRTSRVLANAILESHNYPPITLGSIEPTRYRRACIAFYEMSATEPMGQILTDSYQAFLELE